MSNKQESERGSISIEDIENEVKNLVNELSQEKVETENSVKGLVNK